MVILSNDKTGAWERCHDEAHARRTARRLGWVDYVMEQE